MRSRAGRKPADPAPGSRADGRIAQATELERDRERLIGDNAVGCLEV